MKYNLVAAEAVRQNKAKYCCFLETKQWGQLEKLFGETVTLVFFDDKDILSTEYRSVSEFIKVTSEHLHLASTIHPLQNSKIEFMSQRTAHDIWSMEAYLIFPEQDGRAFTSLYGFGHDHERWECINNQRLLRSFEIRRTILNAKQELLK